MDLDFLLVTFLYLVIILATHSYLKKHDNITVDYRENVEAVDREPREHQENVHYEPTVESNVQPEENDMILHASELDNMANVSTNDFMKYLDIEESDKTHAFDPLVNDNTENLDKGLEESVKKQSSLTRFFENVKENGGEIVFDPVPTSNIIDYNKNGLLKDIKKLNDDNVYDNVNAFDDFTATYAPV